ncbi:hypothetical protein L3X38_033237 [Prunus dulcis]|uniref:Transposable element protein n=1 Tax=Prunus dulcis TaxID=3755 RepID=A0AAD4VFI2_PRUDU|nr:hypothetical protein L3X38_033237 [Prunus dulcis]
MKDIGNASYILGIKIYRDRSRKLIGLSQSLYVDKVLRRFQMKYSKKGFLPVRHGIHLSKSMSLKTPEAVIRMSRILYSFTIGSLIWRCCKQSTTADSTTKAEYIAALEAAKEAIWMKKFITELGVVPSIKQPVILYCDNNRAITQVKEPRSHQRSKHMQRCYHVIWEYIADGDITVLKVALANNIADPLTKLMS